MKYPPELLARWRAETAAQKEFNEYIKTSEPDAILIRVLIDLMQQAGDDDEWLHGAEDKLHQWLLEAIAAGSCNDPEGCAKEALRTKQLYFARWCA